MEMACAAYLADGSRCGRPPGAYDWAWDGFVCAECRAVFPAEKLARRLAGRNKESERRIDALSRSLAGSLAALADEG
jgi:hypothetical protein